MFDNGFRPRPTTPAMREVEKLRQELEKLKDVVYAAKEVLTLEEAAIFMGVSMKNALFNTISKRQNLISEDTKLQPFISKN